MANGNGIVVGTKRLVVEMVETTAGPRLEIGLTVDQNGKAVPATEQDLHSVLGSLVYIALSSPQYAHLLASSIAGIVCDSLRDNIRFPNMATGIPNSSIEREGNA